MEAIAELKRCLTIAQSQDRRSQHLFAVTETCVEAITVIAASEGTLAPYVIARECLDNILAMNIAFNEQEKSLANPDHQPKPTAQHLDVPPQPGKENSHRAQSYRPPRPRRKHG